MFFHLPPSGFYPSPPHQHYSGIGMMSRRGDWNELHIGDVVKVDGKYFDRPDPMFGVVAGICLEHHGDIWSIWKDDLNDAIRAYRGAEPRDFIAEVDGGKLWTVPNEIEHGARAFEVLMCVAR